MAWAEANDVPAGELTDLKAASPAAVKAWAKEQGLDPEAFAEDLPLRSQGMSATPVSSLSPDSARSGDEKSVGASAAGGPLAVVDQAVVDPAEQRAWSRDDEAGDVCSPQVRSWMSAIEAQQGDHPEEAVLLAAAPAWSTAAAQSTNEIRRVQFAADEDTLGVVGYFKPLDGEDAWTAADYGQETDTLGNQQCLHEAAAWMVAKRLGSPYCDIVVPAVIREVSGRRGVVSLAFEPSEEGGWSIAVPGYVSQDMPEQVVGWKARMKAAALFDAITGAQDRHGANWLVQKQTGEFRLIDHGFSFARAGDYLNSVDLQRGRIASGESALEDHERKLLQRIQADPTCLGLVSSIDPSRVAAVQDRVEWMLKHDRVLKCFEEAEGDPWP